MPTILITDILIYALAAAVIYFAISARRGTGLAASVWGHVRKDRFAMIALAVLAAYALIALADSIRWRSRVENTDAAKGALHSAEALSILDRVFTGLRTNTEKTFSAPLAGKSFAKESMTLADGRTVRDYPALKHPGSHLLGTDKVGTDVLYMALKGVRTGVVIGTGATLLMVPFALLFGVLAGYFGGITDDLIQYVYTTLASIPSILLIVAFMLLFGTKGYQGGLVTEDEISLGVFVFNDRLFWLCVIMGITSWTDLCRLIRGETLKLRELEYVQAARAFSVSNAGIIARHLIPNVLHLVLITFVLQFSGLVLAEAVLSYIGIGVGPETGSWGNMINTARLELSREPVVWWNLLAAFAFMFALVLPANVFADSVRDSLDPKLRQGRGK
ncbi:MAG: ABC transporter permease [Deltaproteobacteria bacterium]|nr:ABC transporter permease [Deltaproteobacteria bacterium]